MSKRNLFILSLAISLFAFPVAVFAQQASLSATLSAKEAKQPPADRGNEKAANESETKSPVDVFLEVIEAVKSGDRATVLAHSSPFVSPKAKEFLKTLTPETAESENSWAKEIKALDGKIFGDLSVIVKYKIRKYKRNDRPTDWEGWDLDTDPIFLHRVDGKWIVLLREMHELKPYLDEHKLNARFAEAFSWYRQNEPKIRQKIEIETIKAQPKLKPLSDNK